METNQNQVMVILQLLDPLGLLIYGMRTISEALQKMIWTHDVIVTERTANNAITYAGKGTTMELSAMEQRGQWLFTFSDNGMDIPEEHLPRIFERFYRIDSGRSRDMGGTGFGLAIVKNAALLHGGNIIAKDQDKGGLIFEFTIKKK